MALRVATGSLRPIVGLAIAFPTTFAATFATALAAFARRRGRFAGLPPRSFDVRSRRRCYRLALDLRRRRRRRRLDLGAIRLALGSVDLHRDGGHTRRLALGARFGLLAV